MPSPDKIIIKKSKILFNYKIRKNYFKIGINLPGIARFAEPGQFLQVKVSNGYDPLLRRPFSIHRIKGSQIVILYEVVGKGTELLSKRKPGEYLDVIGPLGNGFYYRATDHKLQNVILVAGGMGIAPLVFLAEKLVIRATSVCQSPKEKGGNTKRLKPLVLIGTRAAGYIVCEKELKYLGCKVKISTDDGSGGFKGKVTDLLKKILRPANVIQARTRLPRQTTIYACGPKPMLKEIINISRKYQISTQLCFEEMMACGIGACLGCVIRTKDGYKCVCKDGPIFFAKDFAKNMV